jgi:hypothetical protein
MENVYGGKGKGRREENGGFVQGGIMHEKFTRQTTLGETQRLPGTKTLHFPPVDL